MKELIDFKIAYVSNIGAFAFVFLTMVGWMIILDKYSVNDKLSRYASYKKWRFLYELAMCRFCTEHFMAVISTVIWGVLNYFDWWLIFLPLMTSSFLNLIKQRKYEKDRH